MNRRTERQWRLALILLIAVALLGIVAVVARAGPWAHGIVQDETAVGVSGGSVRIEHEHQNQWYKERETENMPSAYFGWGLTKPGNYRMSYAKDGCEIVEIRDGEFTLDTVPFGDILIVVKCPTATPTATSFPVPTTLMPPTVDPTATSTPTPQTTPTPNPAVSYITLTAPVVGTVMASQAIALAEYVPASCFEIAATQKGCPLSVTQPWVGKADGACWRFQPFSCPWRSGIELVARCESPCEVGIIPNGNW